ncbi:hypothetical protein L6164_006502 [Bauhinia variegata]|uniref:Uncharacterized protein n=1 Tax=Bauhinia variegata TaxID=167791 RepID=A0ACB9PTV2_BAUVA|nr:hypothetical protein L6164_006502 [Bauhinia variegata]
MEEGLVDWSDLPPELWPKIGKCLRNRIDVLRFRSVCKLWRSSLPPTNPNSPSFPLQIPYPLSSSVSSNLIEATFYRIEPSPPHETPSSSSSSSSSSPKGWLIKVQSSPSMRLLHPLSNRQLMNPSPNSPNLWNLLNYRVIELHKSYTLQKFSHLAGAVNKVVFFPSSSSWVADIEDSVACCIYLEGKLGFMKYGDENWTLVDDKNSYYDDIIMYKGQIYVTDRWGTISWLDISSLKLLQFTPPLCGFGNKKHLVESCGNLYVVDRYYERELPRNRRRNYHLHLDQYAVVEDFKVYKLDEDWGTWVDVKNLGDRVFVLASDCSFSVSAKEFYGFKGNCIFFTDFFDVRVYNLNDQSIVPFEADPSSPQLFWPPPPWLRV